MNESFNQNIIQVTQLPIIQEQLRPLKERWEQYALDAEAMVCTGETIQSVKSFRTDMRKEFDELESLRKMAKKAVLEPYEQFEAIYKECVTDAYRSADAVCSRKVSEVESEIKRRCEEGLREYFLELCAAVHIDFLTYEQSGVQVDLTSAKQKTPKKLREQLMAFVSGVAQDVETISVMENSEELMAEYRQSLSLSAAIHAVEDRYRRIEEEKERLNSFSEKKTSEDHAADKVDAVIAPPSVAEPIPTEDKILCCRFTARGTRVQLKKLKDFMIQEGIRYE